MRLAYIAETIEEYGFVAFWTLVLTRLLLYFRKTMQAGFLPTMAMGRHFVSPRIVSSFSGLRIIL